MSVPHEFPCSSRCSAACFCASQYLCPFTVRASCSSLKMWTYRPHHRAFALCQHRKRRCTHPASRGPITSGNPGISSSIKVDEARNTAPVHRRLCPNRRVSVGKHNRPAAQGLRGDHCEFTRIHLNVSDFNERKIRQLRWCGTERYRRSVDSSVDYSSPTSWKLNTSSTHF